MIGTRGVTICGALFDDMLARPLPQITTFVLANRWALVGLVCVWPVAGLLVFRRSGLERVVTTLAAAVTLQICVTVFALFLPLNRLLQSIQSAN